MINVRNRIFKIYDHYMKMYNKYILFSLQELLESNSDRKVYMVSKIPSHKIKLKQDKSKPYLVSEIKISNDFTYVQVNKNQSEDTISNIVKKYRNHIMLFEMSPFLDVYEYLKTYLSNTIFEYIHYCYQDKSPQKYFVNNETYNYVPANKEKVKKKLQSYYDDKEIKNDSGNDEYKRGILPAYKIYDDNKNIKLCYSFQHLVILDEIYYLQNKKLELEDIEDILFDLEINQYDEDEFIKRQILKKKIVLIEELLQLYTYEELKDNIYNLDIVHDRIAIKYFIEYILSLYYILKNDEVLYSKNNDLKDNDVLLYDLHFYYFLFCINKFHDKKSFTEDEYKKLLNLYSSKYSDLRKYRKEIFEDIYSDNLKIYIHNLESLNDENYINSFNENHEHYNKLKELLF